MFSESIHTAKSQLMPGVKDGGERLLWLTVTVTLGLRLSLHVGDESAKRFDKTLASLMCSPSRNVVANQGKTIQDDLHLPFQTHQGGVSIFLEAIGSKPETF